MYKGELHVVQGDVTKEEDVVCVVKWTRDNLGGADVLVNNAGTMFPVSLVGTPFVFLFFENDVNIVHYLIYSIPEADTQKIRTMLNLNVLGLCMFTREVIKDMRSRGVDDGHIFNINRCV
jgi:NADP+-dependent farnesol dehydrogenase